MSIYEDTNPRELKDLLWQIGQREAALPDFQRDFVWDPNATQELIVSIASNFPAGSLLRIRNTRQLFASREFQGAPPLDGHKTTFLVLDGQQRLTSLYQAFFGVGDHRYYLDLGRLIDGADFEEAIFHLRANNKRAKLLEDVGAQADQLVLPLGVLKGGNGGYLKWTKAVMKRKQAALSDEEYLRLDEALDGVGGRWIQTIDDYMFPVVTLSDETGAEAVCTIFETLNRTGVRLSPFELLTARFWPQNVNLRALWAKAVADGPIIEEFAVDPYYLMVVIALVARSSPTANRSDVLDLSTEDVERWWERAAWGMRTGLELLRDDCGVVTPNWLPYNTMLMPLAAILAKNGLPSGPAAGAARQDLTRWYWCSVFGQRYESSPTSQMARDVTEVVAWLGGGELPGAIREYRFDPRMLHDTTPRQRAVYRGVITLILRGCPRDFHNKAPITGETMIEQGIDDHHVFPHAYLASLEPAAAVRLRDCVLNRTLIDSKTNKSIGKKAPSVYLREMEAHMGTTGLAALLETHLLPAASDGPLMHDDFESFLRWREDAVWRTIQQVTGVTEASDLIDEDEEILE